MISSARDRLAAARLYAIVDLGYIDAVRVPFVTEQLVLGGVDLIQLRAKKLALPEIAKLGQAMRDIIPANGPIFILNDHPELVAGMGADGIHVGQDDLSVDEARKLAGDNALVGKSTHSLAQAVAAEKERPDYIGVGPIYATATKPDYVPIGPALIGQLRAAVRVPQFCIGGVNEKTLPDVIAAGARRVVMVSALLQSADIPGYCQRVRAKLSRGSEPRGWQAVREWLLSFERDGRQVKEGRALLSERPQLDPCGFAEKYFPAEKQAIATKLWKLTQQHSVVDITGIVPNDSFVDDLRMDDLDSMSLVELAVDLEATFCVSIPDGRLAQIHTFGQLVNEIYDRTKAAGDD